VPTTELALFDFLAKEEYLPPLFLANSMPVREAHLLFFPKHRSPLIFANRGASGIDGNIATALGIAEGLQQPLLAILGDQTALHDINSLALCSKAKVPVYFLIINNQGGGIFSFLPVAKHPQVEDLFSAKHSYSFASFAKAFSLPYLAISSLEQMPSLQNLSTSCVIEFQTNTEQNVQAHHNLHQRAQACLNSFADLKEGKDLLSLCSSSMGS